jgi:hypothetical protein
MARAYLKHYYLRRLLEVSFWRKFVRGEISPFAATHSLLVFIGKIGMSRTRSSANRRPGGMNGAAETNPLPDRMADGLRRFRGRVLIIISGRDLTAGEFEDAAATPTWRRLLGAERITRRRLAEADHTFSRRIWRDQVAAWTSEWLKSW